MINKKIINLESIILNLIANMFDCGTEIYLFHIKYFEETINIASIKLIIRVLISSTDFSLTHVSHLFLL